jgi:CBS-domain-containing membrane protein
MIPRRSHNHGKKSVILLQNQSLDEAREIMCEHHLDYLPVVDENMRVMGIVALRDLAAKKTPATKSRRHRSLRASKGDEAKKE